MKFKIKSDIKIDNNYIENFFKNKGINDLREFLKPTKEELLDFQNLDNIVKGANLLKKHICEENNKVLIVVDSDTDGYCSAAAMYLYIKHMNENADIEYFIHEGKQHGLEDVYQDIDSEVKLVIVPDAGSNDFEYHKIIKEQGKDILILDHHECDRGYSSDAIVINNQLSEKYENKALCGAAVVYKFAQCLDNLNNTSYSDNLLTLAAIAMIGDMMLLTHLETRYIIEEGLNNINNLGIQFFIDKQSYSMGNKVTPVGIAFYVVPLMNALIRVGSQEEKAILFKALIEPMKEVPSTKRGAKAGDVELTAAQAVRICANAKSRQDKQKIKSFETLDFKIQKEGLDCNKIIIVTVDPDEEFSTSLTGLVAMQLAAKYKKPVCVVREGEDGYLKGSARGFANTDMGSMRDFCNESGFFDYNAGHSFAYGTSIHKNKLDGFLAYANEKLANVDFNENTYEVDLIIEGDNEHLEEIILAFGEYDNIWGQGIETPSIIVKNIRINRQDVQLIGAKKDTVKFVYNDITFMKFKDAKLGEKLQEFNTMNVTILGRANVNNYMGSITPQIFISDCDVEDVTYEF